MKFYPVSSGSVWTLIVLTCSLGMLSCAQGGKAIATGDCAIATGGSAIITVSPELRASLGDSAIEAASHAVMGYLSNNKGPIDENVSREAKARAVNAAQDVKGMPLTPVEVRALEDSAQAGVGEYKTRCTKS
jgi:hypothetical protein